MTGNCRQPVPARRGLATVLIVKEPSRCRGLSLPNHYGPTIPQKQAFDITLAETFSDQHNEKGRSQDSFAQEQKIHHRNTEKDKSLAADERRSTQRGALSDTENWEQRTV